MIFYVLISLVLIVVVLGGQWAGVILLGKILRGFEWWTIFVGALFATLGSIAYLWSVLGMTDSLNGPIYKQFAPWIYVLGQVLFSIGFLVHVLKILKTKSRVEELELMNLAQATELERLRNR